VQNHAGHIAKYYENSCSHEKDTQKGKENSIVELKYKYTPLSPVFDTVGSNPLE
jgi:hypothetical protein